MLVEVWSDFACPFCYIGKRHFENALQRFEHKNKVDIVFKSFQLDPNAPMTINKDIHQSLAEKYGMSYEKAKEMGEQVSKQAKTVGLDYYFDTMILTNTFAAHRLSHFAKQQGKMNEMMERLLYAYFTESKNIGDYNTLVELAGEIGIDREQALQVLEENRYANEVLADQQIAARIGVRGVPFFVFNEKYAVSGAQPSDAFLEVLQKVWEEEQEKQPLQILNEKKQTKTEYCTDDSCNIE